MNIVAPGDFTTQQIDMSRGAHERDLLEAAWELKVHLRAPKASYKMHTERWLVGRL